MANTFSLSDIFGPSREDEPETFSLEEIFGQPDAEPVVVPGLGSATPEPGIGAERRLSRTGVDNLQAQAEPVVPVFDPFAGESFSDLARRRGQQFVRGAGEVAASVPEAVSIGQAGLEMRNRDAAAGQLDERAETIRNFEAILERPDLNDQQRDYYQAQLDAYLQGQEVLEGQRAAEVVPPQERELFQQGDTIRQGVEDRFGAPDPRDTSFWAMFAEGAGNMTALGGLSLLGPGGVALSAGAGSAMNTSQVYREAIDAGADEETAMRAAKFAAGIGASEIIPITRALKALPPRLRPQITGGVLRRFVDTAQGAGEEAAQEYLAQVANNLVAQNLYDADRGWNEGAAESALVGAVLGGPMGLAGSYMSPDRQPTATRPPSIRGTDEQPDQPLTPQAGSPVVPPSTPSAPNMPPAPTRLDQPETRRAPTLPEMPENLKPGDAESPVPNDILSAGRNVMDAIARGEPIPMPSQPLPDALPQGLGEAAGPALQTTVAQPAAPEAEAVPAPSAQPAPQRQAAPDLPAYPLAADVPPAIDTTSQVTEREARENVTDWMPEIDVDADGVETETGRLVRVNLDTGEPEIFGQEAAPETPQNAEPSPAVPVDAPETEATTGEVPDGVEATESVSRPVAGLEILANEDLTSIEAEPDTFQYKSGGDAEGVTDRLLGVKRWETPRAGQAIVFEYNDGRRVIADGHQRIGLAKRLRAEGQDVAMPVTIRREADGYTPEGVMVEAALKNIAESSATNPDDGAVIDAAKVLRSDPSAIDQMNLPQGEKSALGRNAKTLTALSDDAFGMVVNERASMRSALAVAKAVQDRAAQANILNVVEKSGARNAFEAEQVARQAAADTVVQTQDSLFGSEEVTETLYLERARVMDQAIKRLRKEAGAFKTILRNSGNIEAVGDNRVDRDASERRASEDAAAQEYITRLANSKGPISEALTEAARNVKSGGDLGQAVTGFVKAVRTGLQESSAERAGIAPSGAANEQAGSATESTGQDGLSGLTEAPAQAAAEPVTEETDAGDQTLIPGVEPITQADRNRAEIQARAEAPMQGGQQGGQGGRGDLFGDPAERGDLFDQAPEEPSQQYEPISRTERRLFNALRDEWTARENLPDTEEGNAAFVAATERVSAARKAFADEYGQNKVNAALERIESEYQPQDAASGRKENNKPDDTKPRERIEDFGEKIGGARKDTATPTGPRPTRKKDERPASQRRYQVTQIAADAFNKDRVGKWTISDTRSKSGRIPGFGRGKLDFDTREEAEAALPMVAVSRNHSVMSDGDGFKIVRKVSDRKRPTVKDGFKTREEAMAYMAANATEIAETKLRIDDSIHPALEEALRVGDQRRENDRDVTSRDFVEIFGFRGVEFGNWNNTAERQHLLNQAFDAFLDLAEITRVPPRALSLHGELGLAFGARGQGLQGARAHYERNYGVINLTKIKGAGSLAHEWWHAVDHYFARMDGSAKPRDLNAKEGEPIYDAKTPREDYASHGFLYKSGLREEVRADIKNLMATILKRKAQYTEDQSSRERVSKRQIERVNSLLDGLEKELSTEQRYGRKKAPATKEQMQRFKRAALKIKAGKDLGEMVDAPTKAQFASYRFYEPVMEIAEVYKEVRGRQAYGQRQGRKYGAAVDLQNAIETRNQAQQFLDDAKAEKVKEKTVRSEFYSEAWMMDQGSKTDYWSTNHELAARSFESYVYDRLKEIDARNDFLAYEKRNDLPEYKLFNVKPYPEGQERADMNAAWDKLFETIQSKEDGDAVMLYQRPLDMFYSPLLKAVSSAKQKQAPAKDWKAIVAKLPGVKKAELEWLGVDEWLDTQEGQVPREALVSFIRDSQIEIVEEVGGPQGDGPDIRIGDRQVVEPTDDYISDLADDLMEDARASLYEAYQDDEVEVRAAAEEMAMDQYYDSPEYTVTVYDANGTFERVVSVDSDGSYNVDGELLDESGIYSWAEDEAQAEGPSDEADFAANFEDYTEDGGENYREMLLRVPNLHKTGKNQVKPTPEQQRRWDDLSRRQEQAVQDEMMAADGAGRMAAREEMRQIMDERDTLAAEIGYGAEPFVQSAHFEQENIVVHARVKDRTGANGEKVLFVEEIQSDLASTWRESQEAPEVTARRRELEREYQNTLDQKNKIGPEITDIVKAAWESGELSKGGVFDFPVPLLESMAGLRGIRASEQPIVDAAMDWVAKDAERFELFSEWRSLTQKLMEIEEERLRLGTEKSMPEGTPDTPFKEEATYTLMVKRLLREAAENGYDRLSWTPGYMQAERWNNAAQSVVEGVEWGAPDADSIAAAQEGSGTDLSGYRYVYLQMGDRSSKEELTVNPSGKVDSGPGPLEGKQLSQIVGPNLAKQIMTEREGSVSGQKITFPDSGYAIAYDQQIKKAVDKFAKKYGARVRVDKTLPDFAEPDNLVTMARSMNMSETEAFNRLRQAGIEPDTTMERQLAREESWGREAMGDRDQVARLIMLRSASKRGRILDVLPDSAKPVWSIDITPELREAAMEPMAMFRKDTDYKRGTALAFSGDLAPFRKELDELGLKEVKLELAGPDATYQGALRIDRKDGMTMLIGRAMDVTNTIHHEAIHALRAMNLFSEMEWRTLSQAAEGWIKKHDIEVWYPDLSRLGQIEEAIAEEFSQWTGKGGPFGKIKNFIEALGNFLRGRGFQTVDDIFDLTATGVVGARERSTAREVVKYQRPPLNAQGRATVAENTQTPHIPSPSVYNVSARRNNAFFRLVANPAGVLQEKVDWFRRGIQDELIYLRRAEEAISEARGVPVDKSESVYHNIERYYGQVGVALNELHEKYTRPIGVLIGRNAKKLSLEDHNGDIRTGVEAVSLYLWARHAKERNARIAKITGQDADLLNPNPDKWGSGLTDSQAEAILKRAKLSPAFNVMQQIGQMADQLGREMVDTRVQAGLLSEQEGAIWKAQYKHYVPLRGFAETDMYDAVGMSDAVARGPGKFNVRGKEGKMALGRKSEPFDKLSNLIAEAEEVTVRARKNLVGQAMRDMVENNPAPGLWEIKRLETRRVYNRASGRVETQILNAADVQLKPDEMAMKIDGVEHRVKLNDERLARAMGTLGTVTQMDPFTRGSSYFSRYFSSVNTMLNPEFVIINGFRDMMTAQVLLAEQAPPHLKNKMRRKAQPFSPDYWKSLTGVYQGLKDSNAQSEYAKWFKEFSEAGARVSFWNIENPQARKDSLDLVVKDETGNIVRRGVRKFTRLDTDRNPVLRVVERANLAVDNAIRLAVYVEGRKNGMTKDDAASLSKNLTVNFNRKGEWGPHLNAWFPFANAGIQGSHVLVRGIARSKGVRYSVGTMILVGYGLEMLGAALSDEEEDGVLTHDKIPSHVSERNLIIPTGGDTRITIPLPYGLNTFFFAGQQLAKLQRGVKSVDRTTADTLSAAFNGFSPISGENLTQTITPTLLQHGLELYTNEDWLGRPIRPESAFNDYGPQSYKEWNVPWYWSKISRGLNNMTGGSPAEAGWIDISPEYIDHSMTFLTGGMGRFFKNTVEVGTSLATGEEVEAYQIPFARKLRYEVGDFIDQGRYFAFKELVDEASSEVKTARELGISVSPEKTRLAMLTGKLKETEKRRRVLSEQINTIWADDRLTDAQKRERVKPLREMRHKVYLEFNGSYTRIMGPQSE